MSSSEETQNSGEGHDFQDIDYEEAGKYDKNESSAEEGQPRTPLTKEIIAECISMPYRLGYGFSHAFVKLDCSDRRLSDIELLRGYIHLRFVILTNNFITDISPISHIGHLIYLKADNNQIERVDSLGSLRFLQYLDLSGNKLKSITDLVFPLLQHLKVNDNAIESLNTTGYGIPTNHLPTVHTLEIRSNKLTTLDGVSGIHSLTSLYCAENGIRDLNGIATLYGLIRLHARDNQIRSLSGLSAELTSLEYVNLRGNRISTFSAVKELSILPSLKVLNLLQNPVCRKDQYRLIVIGLLPRLQKLDKERVTESERSEGAAVVANKHDWSDDVDEAEAMEEHHNAEGAGEEMADEGERVLNEQEQEGEDTAQEQEEEDEED